MVAMDALTVRMREYRFLKFLPDFVIKLGVECVDDLELVTASELPLVGLKPLQARRFCQLLADPTTSLVGLPLSPSGPSSSAPASAAELGSATRPSVEMRGGFSSESDRLEGGVPDCADAPDDRDRP